MIKGKIENLLEKQIEESINALKMKWEEAILNRMHELIISRVCHVILEWKFNWPNISVCASILLCSKQKKNWRVGVIASIDLHQIESHKRRWRELLIKWIFKIDFVSGWMESNKKGKEIFGAESFGIFFVHLVCFWHLLWFWSSVIDYQIQK